MRQGCHTRANVNGDAAELLTHHFAFAGVHAGAHIDPKRAHGIGDCNGAANGARRAVESCEKAIASSVDLATPVPCEFTADERVMMVEQMPPALVEKDASRVKNRASAGSSQKTSMFDTQPGTRTRSGGPFPRIWYAMFTSPLFAYRVSGSIFSVYGHPRHGKRTLIRAMALSDTQNLVGFCIAPKFSESVMTAGQDAPRPRHGNQRSPPRDRWLPEKYRPSQ